MKYERKDWVYMAKGIAIILMVFGHSGLPKIASNWIWAFHMPLFFILSGAFTTWDRDIISFIKGKLKTLITYFLIYSILNFLLLQLVEQRFNQQDIIYLLLNGWGGFALWFVPVLFLALTLTKLLPPKFDIVSILALLFLGGILDCLQIRLPWTLSTVPAAASFVLIGRRLSHLFRYKINIIAQQKKGIALTVVSFASFTVISHFWRCDLASNHVTPVIPIAIGGVAGTIFTCILSIWLCKTLYIRKILCSVGKNTMEIMSFSQLFCLLQYKLPISGSLKLIIMFILVSSIVYFRKQVLALIGNRVISSDNR